ncbi:helix-turn-helix transcriptional regulator [Amycolatopsis sp. PS_44_ISF1]|uniref:AraC family transcriptional regulator n=1 Tax=Amycolatopsis sp. PS_44_ISF1 TaxID=2974917 RepID=UPI0028DDA93D|nr:helix-turn-helix transcriptional regulator [Amycolatopsis sp. PS_44_ISF1]MDT8911341.1 helix-turn-helix transcriptional regulator [Amycolatopsis sp. PS_44_ISF1]
MLLADLELPAGAWFPGHEHPVHQLVWSARGVVAVTAGDAHWVLPTTRALWVPAGVWHRTGAVGNAVLRGIYAAPQRCPVSWPEPRIVAVGPLLRALLDHLTGGQLADGPRRRAEAVAFDLLQPLDLAPIVVPSPLDPRARDVQAAVLADPADRRGLAELGRAVGAGERTLARAFTHDCGMTFGTWRTQVRLRASLPLLAAGQPMEAVARQVGYSTASAFVAAFRRSVGVTPGAYFAS